MSIVFRVAVMYTDIPNADLKSKSSSYQHKVRRGKKNKMLKITGVSVKFIVFRVIEKSSGTTEFILFPGL